MHPNNVRCTDKTSKLIRAFLSPKSMTILAIVFGFLWVPFTLSAQDLSQPVKTEGTAFAGKNSQVVVLTSGKTLRGIVNQKETGIEIKIRNRGIRTFPKEDIQVIQPDLKSAYQELSRSIPVDSVSHHMELSYWCQQNQLLPEMVKELKLVLVLNKDHQEAAKLLKEYLPKVEGIQGDLVLGTIARNNNTIVLTGGSEETLTGLPAKMAAEFSSRIQPLLRNKCGTTKCHGSLTTTSFQLFPRTRSKSKNRVHTQNNLLAAFSQINQQQIEQSELWIKATTPHGNMKQPVLHQGKSATLQKANLSNWIVSITQYVKENPDSELAKQIQKKTDKTLQGSSGNPIQTVNGSDMRTPKEPEMLNGILLKESVISDALRKTEPDVFDPAEFNQKK